MGAGGRCRVLFFVMIRGGRGVGAGQMNGKWGAGSGVWELWMRGFVRVLCLFYSYFPGRVETSLTVSRGRQDMTVIGVVRLNSVSKYSNSHPFIS